MNETYPCPEQNESIEVSEHWNKELRIGSIGYVLKSWKKHVTFFYP